MKLLLRLFAAGGLLAAVHSSAADSFEGRISLAVSTGKGRPQTMNYAMKGGVVRMDIEAEGQAMASIMDPGKKEMIMLMPEQQMYMVMPLQQPIEQAQQAAAKEPAVEKTGRTDTILGYKCDEYVSKDKGTTTEIWIAEGLGSFMGLGSGGNPMMGGRSKPAGGWEGKFKGKPGFPLRVISRDAKGKETFRMETTKIEPGSLPASLFQPPADYQKFQMPDMGGLNPFKQG